MERNCKKHGIHSDWRYQESKKEYSCRFCIREGRAKKRQIKNEACLANQFGESAVSEYSEFLNENKDTASSHINSFRFKKRLEDYPETIFTGQRRRYRAIIWRIELLNSICGYKHGNIGWSCSSCGEFDSHQSFFDIDHIVAKCNGGEDTVENYQVLCPNCHKRKTLNVDRKVTRVKS